MIITVILTLLLIMGALTGRAQQVEVPLVYNVENTGSRYEAPMMPDASQLPMIRELPDALEGVTTFADCCKRRSDIGHMIQHYGIGIKPTVESSQVKARIRARRWWSRCLAQIA